LYAFWTKNSSYEEPDNSDVTNILLNQEMEVYDVMGRLVGNQLPTDQHGVFIIIQGKNQAKIIL
jgi:hypothetical protein